ncbi:hypothetical protein QO010_003694 [Caulobacter ginsengisoli]|uniref:DUF2125 domain-containing protein n=1 Tax=Caulobacter ginsengisoli TaxID=400775 RepID=A0ABU0IY70_9CAUL|nr:DUF2125 domain-containing protein [Caulobacter ginsengisoli]MDQ0465902.1 hypothetical protein [Caulobacter ginsengisoli]
MTLPDQAPPRKARRRGLVIPWLLMLILVVGVSGGWWWLRIQAETQLNAAVKQARADGYEISWQSVHYGGFPFRLDVEFTGLTLGDTAGWKLAAPSLHTEAYVYRLDHWVAVASQGVVLTRPQGGVVRITGDALRASLSEPNGHPPRITIEGANLRFDPAPGAKPYLLSAARKLDVALRAGPSDQAAFLFHAEGARLNLQGLAGRVADQGEGTIDWTLVFSKASALHGRDWTGAVRSWARAGGALQVDSASLQVGQALLKTTGGSLSVQSDGRLKGSLPASLKAVDGSPGQINGTLTLSNGEAILNGFLHIGPAPKLF